MKSGELLALCREMKNLSLREVEAATGLSKSRIGQIENGAPGLSFKSAVKLCDLYGITLDRLAATIRSNDSKGGAITAARGWMPCPPLNSIEDGKA